MTLTVVTPPDGEAVSLSSAKSYLRLGHDGEDDLVASLIAGAVAAVEEAAGFCLLSRTLRETFLAWPQGLLRTSQLKLGGRPVTSLVDVGLVDAEGVSTDISGRFGLEGDRICLRPGSWLPRIPPGGRVEIDFIAGFGAADDVPDDLKLAILIMIEAAYRRGGSEGAMPDAAARLIDARREVRL
ncbi:head-tail connector protein [Henriciella marina]|uniref:head-tail connector protein n=1 Tax=Henriciella marina TaxID=453851 RepID=UPI00035DF693|nr:hypothetical protein [Henriciella marina]